VSVTSGCELLHTAWLPCAMVFGPVCPIISAFD
jgi:hypothetical protein